MVFGHDDAYYQWPCASVSVFQAINIPNPTRIRICIHAHAQLGAFIPRERNDKKLTRRKENMGADSIYNG